MNRLLILLAFTAVLSIGPEVLYAQDEEKEEFNFDKEFAKTANLIVMISAEFGRTPEFGAGIIFGRQKDRLLIATAYHILHSGAQKPQKIHVKLRSMPEKIFEATMLNYSEEKDMDLAVLSLDNLAKQGINICTLPFDRLGWTSELERGDDVYPVGNPNGVSWAMPVSPDKISQIVGKQIIFQSAFISRGHSGGGLIDEKALLIGMTTADEPPYGRAINLDAVLGMMRKWQHPVQLDTTLADGLTPLHEAANKGDPVAIRNLLEDCGDVNARDDHMATPLHFAASSGNIDAISDLIKAGANLNALDADGDPPLEWAVENGHLETVKYLVKAGAKINTINELGLTVLGMAVKNKKTEIVNFLITAGANVNSNQSSKTSSSAALAEAVESGNLAIVQNLIAAGAKADVNMLDRPIKEGKLELVKVLLKGLDNLNARFYESDETLLHRAVKEGNLGIVKQLVSAGMDINAPGYKKETPLFIVFQNEINEIKNGDTTNIYKPIENFLISNGANVKGVDSLDRNFYLFRASEYHQIVAVSFLLEAGTSPNITSAYGSEYTPLEFATGSGDVPIVRFLIKAGADINETAYEGYTPIYIAVENDNMEMVKILVEAGADINKAGNNMSLPLEQAIISNKTEILNALLKSTTAPRNLDKLLQYAVEEDKADIVKLLLSKGANSKVVWPTLIESNKIKIIEILLDNGIKVNDELDNGETPLHSAVQQNNIEVVKLLLRAGAKPNERGDGFETPLETAAMKGNIDIVKLFLQAGVDVNGKNKNGESPLQLVVDNEYASKEMVTFLLANHANVNAGVGSDEIPLQLAVKQGNAEIVKILLTASAKTNLKDKSGSYPIHYVDLRDFEKAVEIIEALLNAGADINAKNSDGETVLTLAVKDGNERITKWLIDHGAK